MPRQPPRAGSAAAAFGGVQGGWDDGGSLSGSDGAGSPGGRAETPEVPETPETIRGGGGGGRAGSGRATPESGGRGASARGRGVRSGSAKSRPGSAAAAAAKEAAKEAAAADAERRARRYPRNFAGSGEPGPRRSALGLKPVNRCSMSRRLSSSSQQEQEDHSQTPAAQAQQRACAVIDRPLTPHRSGGTHFGARRRGRLPGPKDPPTEKPATGLSPDIDVTAALQRLADTVAAASPPGARRPPSGRSSGSGSSGGSGGGGAGEQTQTPSPEVASCWRGGRLGPLMEEDESAVLVEEEIVGARRQRTVSDYGVLVEEVRQPRASSLFSAVCWWLLLVLPLLENHSRKITARLLLFPVMLKGGGGGRGDGLGE